MNSEQVKSLLHAYRRDLDSLAGDDETVAVCLKALEGDEDLRAFVEAEAAFDKAVTAKFQAIEPPAGLLDAILAGPSEPAGPEVPAMEEPPALDRDEKVITIPWFRNPMIWAAAASIAIVGTVAIQMAGPGSPDPVNPDPVALSKANTGISGVGEGELQSFVQMVANHSDNIDGLDFRNEDSAKLSTFLSEQNTPFPHVMPTSLKELNGIGCQSFSWKGAKVGMICFRGDKVYHLYVADRAALPDLKDIPKPVVRQVGSRSVASWTCQSCVYVLTVDGEEDALSPLL